MPFWGSGIDREFAEYELHVAPASRKVKLRRNGALAASRRAYDTLAHPHFLKTGSFLRRLLELPLDGIECYYAAFRAAQEAPWLKLAQEKGWLVTGGSDYHGTVKPHITLGCSWVGLELFEALKK